MNTDNPIYNIWLINKKNSLCMLQKNYSFKTNIDNDLFSGFITAIFNFSEELSGESVKSITMGTIKLFYKTSNEIILALAANYNLIESDIAPILENILNYFKIEGYDAFLDNELQNSELFTPFIKTIDDFIAKSSDFLNERISQNKYLEKKIERLKEERAQTRFSPLIDAIKIERNENISDNDIEIYKQSIIETIENAEYALQNKNYQDAIIYWGVAAGLFEDIGDDEKSKMCKQHVSKLRNKINEPDFGDEAYLINSIDEEEHPVILEIEPIIPFELIDDEKISITLKKAYEAELKHKYGEASTYYNSASGLFTLKKDHKNAEKCSNYAKKILNRQQNEINYAVHMIGGKFPEEKMLEKETNHFLEEVNNTESLREEKKGNKFFDDELNQLLNNAKLAEELNLFEKAITFYEELIKKLEFFEDFETIKKFKEKIYELNLKFQLENYKFEKIIQLGSLKDDKIIKNLSLAYDFEEKGNFSQAGLYYNIVAGLFSIKKDDENAKKCSSKAKELLKLKEIKF
ncbi:MAG: hypothetical protein EAX96_09800 [Candidatus Lokiarchaeota archaeon]|nr:hypothetical protein [Candidatus Lokiarchaeota archaeon]